MTDEKISAAQCLGDPGSVLPRNKEIRDGDPQYERIIDWQLRALADQGHLLDPVVARLFEFLASEEDITFTIHHGSKGWLTGAEWGREAPDSAMVAAAAYGDGDTLLEAIDKLLTEAHR